MSKVHRFDVGDVALTRVEYFDVALDAAVAGLTAKQIASVPWATPVWAGGDGQVRVGQVGWVVESEGVTIVVDPCGAADPFLRSGDDAVRHQEAFAAEMAKAGVEPGRVDVLVLSHLDGIGMAAKVDAAGRWHPFFDRARVVMSRVECDFVTEHPETGGAGEFAALRAAGAVDAVELPHRITSEVRLVETGGHSPGHAALEVESRGERAVFTGHLTINPVNAAFAPAPDAHVDAARAGVARDAILDAAATNGTLVIGSLWPAPGAARVVGTGTARELVPAQ